MARIPPKSVLSHTVQVGGRDVSTKRATYGGQPSIPKHWDQDGQDVPGLGMELLSVSMATPATLPNFAGRLPPHPQSYTKGQNGLDRSLASLRPVDGAHVGEQFGYSNAASIETQATSTDADMGGSSGTQEGGSGKLPSAAK